MSKEIRAVIALLILGIMLGCAFALLRAGVYGFTLFFLFPSAAGALASWTVRPESWGRAARIGALAGGAAPLLILFAGQDGAICVFMATPLAAALGALGGWLVWGLAFSGIPAGGYPALLFLPIATLAWDFNATPPVYEVRSSIEVAASPEQVWKYVIAFPQLPEPAEWFFRAGLAYPIRAHIDGSGPGSIRYREFSTGPFVEPIQVWDEPRLLRFSVTENPPPMRELSLYPDVEPKHLHGYMVSKQGQFRLTPLANGHTLLEGTSWYRRGLWPAQYWRWWSDAIVHRVHLRVLNHIRDLAEQDAHARLLP
jgi:hypothetical protein